MTQLDEIEFSPRMSASVDALRHREFRIFFAGTVLANLAQWMQQFALGWLAIELAVRDGQPSRGAFYIGLLGLARLIPAAGFGLIGGVTADRIDRRKVLVTTRTASSLIVGTIAALTLSGHINIVLLMLLTALSASTFAFDGPARLSLVPMIVPRHHAFSALGMTRATMQAAGLIGPLIGGLLIVPFGVGGVIALNTVLYALSGIGLGQLRPAPPSSTVHLSPLNSFREGLGYVRRVPSLRAFMTVTIVFTIFANSYVQLIPAVAHDTLMVGALQLSWLVSASGLGALVGALFITTMGSWGRPGWVLLTVAFVLGTLLVVLGLQRSLVPAIAVIAVLSCALVTYNGGTGNIIQMTVPDSLRGRVMGLHVTTFQTGTQLGTLILGTVGSYIGISNAIIGAGIVILLTAITMSRVTAIRDVGLRSQPAAAT
jgi:MFS family permease